MDGTSRPARKLPGTAPLRVALTAAAVAGVAWLLVGPGGSAPAPDRSPAWPWPMGRAHVVRVLDGDTIVVDLAGRRESVRYIGIDTPETGRPGTAGECLAREATRENRLLVEGRTVRLERDAEPRDRFGRLLSYVHVDGRSVNELLVRRGLARTLEVPPNTARAGRLRSLERRARRARRGLWAACRGR